MDRILQGFQGNFFQLLNSNNNRMHQNHFQSEYFPKLEANFKSNQVSQIQQIVIEMLENLVNYCPNCEKKQYEESLKISPIHQQETKKQSKQDDLKKQDKKSDKSIEKTDNKNQQLLYNLSESCSICTSKQKYFSDTVLQLLTGVHPQLTDQIQNEQYQQQIQKKKINPTIQALQVLKQVQNLGQIKQTFCGKILTRNDIGFKCYDCEMDNTCIICKDCFEKGNHKGHRVYQQQGCQGMCDCGDIEAWKKEGFCSDHQGFIQEDKINLNELPEQFRNNFFAIFGEIIYQVVYLVEQFQKWKLKDISRKNLNRFVQSHPRISNIIEFLFATLDMILGKSMLLTALLQKFLNSYFQDFNSANNLPFTILQHNCQDISNNNNLQIDEKISQQCSCTILDLIFRYNMAFDQKVQRKIEEFFITKLFTLYTFKQQLILAYTKNFNFFVLKTNEKQDQQKARLSESNIENDVPQIYVSKVMSMAVQLFTSDELALLAIERNL
ncbi:hypothetical protein PPERSA_12973 [Pseudocohnilembus persalinus]|uniref:E3 ubiquitin-protein ligase n=1 Tax=Pseudocohnilembus persalinus TaxID=266149 RepID=A0A0V0R1V4_PSEPJ|nr:hypothetical protein PPERSA_12973 [Pseudocohnilembus persalinus]|eukprot:KRX08492.1 hypothetical protein PPERSA_12973 [Pseudocohnilembus persalinus]